MHCETFTLYVTSLTEKEYEYKLNDILKNVDHTTVYDIKITTRSSGDSHQITILN